MLPDVKGLPAADLRCQMSVDFAFVQPLAIAMPSFWLASIGFISELHTRLFSLFLSVVLQGAIVTRYDVVSALKRCCDQNTVGLGR